MILVFDLVGQHINLVLKYLVVLPQVFTFVFELLQSLIRILKLCLSSFSGLNLNAKLVLVEISVLSLSLTKLTNVLVLVGKLVLELADLVQLVLQHALLGFNELEQVFVFDFQLFYFFFQSFLTRATVVLDTLQFKLALLQAFPVFFVFHKLCIALAFLLCQELGESFNLVG